MGVDCHLDATGCLVERNDASNGAENGPSVLLTVSDPTQLLAEVLFKTSAYGVARAQLPVGELVGSLVTIQLS
jgi:hypothetical protein